MKLKLASDSLLLHPARKHPAYSTAYSH